jgi:hypothetical protein
MPSIIGCFVLGLGVLVGVGACASGGGSASARAGDSRVVVADVKSVAGRWAGLMDLPGSMRNQDQFVEVRVLPDGTYEATSARTIGMFDARGTVAVKDGHLVMQGEQGARGQGTLVSRDGETVLMVDMTRPDGGRVSARLRPQR